MNTDKIIAESIAKEYAPKEHSKIIALKKLDAKAKRPANSRMSKEKLSENGFERLPAWQDALARYLQIIL